MTAEKSPTWDDLENAIQFGCATVSVDGLLSETDTIVARVAFDRPKWATLMAALGEHDRDITALRKGKEIDWAGFLARRSWFFARHNEAVACIMTMREVPVRSLVAAKVRP